MQPTFQRKQVMRLLASDRVVFTNAALRGMQLLSLDAEAGLNVLLSVGEADFHKTMESQKFPGTMLDVYRPYLGALRLYVKWTVQDGADGPFLYVVSFKEHVPLNDKVIW